MQLLDGTACSQQIRQEIALEVEAIVAAGKRPPHLAAVLVGDDGASQNYVGMKVRDCEEVGFGSTTCQDEGEYNRGGVAGKNRRTQQQ